MCQISLCNLRNGSLNQLLFLLMGSSGSFIHNDGWGFCDVNGMGFKTSLSMSYTADAGKLMRDAYTGGKEIFLGHIRQASAKVPVCNKNSHPFWDKKTGIAFVHNGTLTPKEEKNFVMQEEVNEIDTKTRKPVRDEKTGEIKKVKVNRSDSLIFFEEFLKHYKDEEHFVEALNETMELFTGKFAFVFLINKTFYIARGRTADLHISYVVEEMKKDAPVLGWAINTNKEVLDSACVLLSNINQLNGKAPINFTFPELLKAETIFKAGQSGLEIIGEIKETTTPTTYSYSSTNWKGYAGAGNFTKGGGKSTSIKPGEKEKLYQQIVEFMLSLSLSPGDIQNIFFMFYGVSTLEVKEEILRHFCTKAIPRINARTDKSARKRLRKVLSGSILAHWMYETGMKYPWFLNTKKEQIEFVDFLEEKQRKAYASG